MKALVAGLVFVCLLCLGRAQTHATDSMTAPETPYVTSRSNLLSISNAVRIAAGLRVGMTGDEVYKHMQDHGMAQTNIYSISLDRGRTMTCPYPLAGGTLLMLDMHCTVAPSEGLFGWKAPVFDRAYIQNKGGEIISTTLEGSSPPAGGARGGQPFGAVTNTTPSAADIRRSL